MSKKIFIGAALAVLVLGLIPVSAEIWAPENRNRQTVDSINEDDNRVLPVKEFVALATQNDTEFREILIDELALQYQRDLELPARDLVLSVSSQMEFFLEQDREDPATLLSLSKDFPLAGSTLEASYQINPRLTSTDSTSQMAFTLAQSIAQNAFGYASRLEDKLIGVEVKLARHQIFEAYEDYFGSLLLAYLEWYESYENLKIGRSSYKENLKLLDNIKERQKSKIALPIDVNKVTLQVLAKKETLIELEEIYGNRLNTIERAIRYDGDQDLVPELPESLFAPREDFDAEYADFKEAGRTYEILDLLEKQSGLQVAVDADALLPSIDLLVGYERDGVDYGIENGEGLFFVGLSADWPLFDQIDKAEHRISEIHQEKVSFQVSNTHYRLYTLLKNLHLAIDREKQLAEIAIEKVDLAQAILEGEADNYTYGKVTLNDYIQAVNTLDNNRFNRVLHEVGLRKRLVDWHRLTDTLARESEIKRDYPEYYSSR